MIEARVNSATISSQSESNSDLAVSTLSQLESHSNLAVSIPNQSRLITFDLAVLGVPTSLRALIDTGASSNFIRSSALKDLPPGAISDSETPRTLIVTLADGSTLRVPKRVARLSLSFDGFKGEDDFILLDLDQKFDVILGMPWLKRHQPTIDWDRSRLSSFRTAVEQDLAAHSSGEPSHLTLISIGDEDVVATVCDGPASNDIECDVISTTPPTVSVVNKPKKQRRSVSSPSPLPVFTSADPHAVLQELEENHVSSSRDESRGTTPSTGSVLDITTPSPIGEGVSVASPVLGDGAGPSVAPSDLDGGAEATRVASSVLDDGAVHVSVLRGILLVPSTEDTGGRKKRQQGVTFHPSVKTYSVEELSSKSLKLRKQFKRPTVWEAVHLRRNRPTTDSSGPSPAPEQGESHTAESNVEGNIADHDIQHSCIATMMCDQDGVVLGKHLLSVENPPATAEGIMGLQRMSNKAFLHDLKRGEIVQVCMISTEHADLHSSSNMDEDVLDEKTRKERYDSQSWESLKDNPVYPLIREYSDVFPEKPPECLPPDRGVQHEIDLVPGTKYCVTRQWPLPREQAEAVDAFFANRQKIGHVRESKSPHTSPTFCVKKATGGWRVVHAYNKLNDATIPAQTPVPRKDMIIDGMTGSCIFSAIDLMDGFYQVLMRQEDIPLTAVSTPSGMLWEWLVMPQGLMNAPATFNRMVSQILRPLRSFAPSYFDDIFVHSKAEGNKSALEVHLDHLRELFQTMRKNKLYASLKKCVFAAPEIPVLGCFVGKHGVRADPEKVKAIDAWPTPRNVKELRQWLGLANYLHKYSKNYAALVRPLTLLLRKDEVWRWTPSHQDAFAAAMKSLRDAPVLARADYTKPFHVVCDASDFAIGCALMQHDDDGHERVVSYQSRQLKPAERNYPVHDKELLAMKYALVKLRVYLLGESKFAIYTDHASLRTATKSPHLSQRMARWLSFFAEYNFVVHYKPGKTNILADALSRRPDFDPRDPNFVESEDITCLGCSHEHLKQTTVRAESSLPADIISAYARDAVCHSRLTYFSSPSAKALDALSASLRSKIHRYQVAHGLLFYSIDGDTPRIVVPDDAELRMRILYEYHDSPMGGHLGREKTFLAVSRDFYWAHQYKWVRKYVRTCDTCQRMKPSPSTQAPLRSLPIPLDCWRSVSMDFIFGLPPDKHGRTGILVFVDRFSKMVHLIPVFSTIDADETARLFVAHVFRLHGMPNEIVSDRDPRFTSKFWRAVFLLVGTKLSMSTAAHPQTDGQTERANRTLEDVLRSFATSFKDWSEFLTLVEFALNHSVHSTTGVTPFFLNTGRHPLVPASLLGEVSLPKSPQAPEVGACNLSGGGFPSADSTALGNVQDGTQHVSASAAHVTQTELARDAIARTVQGGTLHVDATATHDAKCTSNDITMQKTQDGAISESVHSVTTRGNRSVRSGTTLHTHAQAGAVQEPVHNSTTPSSNDFNFEVLEPLGHMTRTKRKAVNDFLLNRQVVVRYVRDAMANAVDKQKENADRHGRNNKNVFKPIGVRCLNRFIDSGIVRPSEI